METIGEGCFQKSGLTELTIPNSVTKIERCVFNMCHELKKVTLPEGLEVIPEDCFLQSGLEELRLPASVERVGPYAFFDCGRLECVEFAAGSRLRVMEESAFCDCTALAVCELPAGADVAPNAFKGTPLEEARPEEDEEQPLEEFGEEETDEW